MAKNVAWALAALALCCAALLALVAQAMADRTASRSLVVEHAMLSGRLVVQTSSIARRL